MEQSDLEAENEALRMHQSLVFGHLRAAYMLTIDPEARLEIAIAIRSMRAEMIGPEEMQELRRAARVPSPDQPCCARWIARVRLLEGRQARAAGVLDGR
jgi:hypothetical protein